MKKITVVSIILIISAAVAGAVLVIQNQTKRAEVIENSADNNAATGTVMNLAESATTSEIPASASVATGAIFNVPFTSQAPFGNWKDIRQEDGCEEASALMAVHWARNERLTPEESEREIIAISDYELAKYGYFEDTSIRDTATRILSGYFGFENFEVRTGIGTADIIAELAKGNIAIVAVAGQEMANPFYTPPGPVSHMLVIIGYDAGTKEFVTNDPGTKHGEKFRYPDYVIQRALRDYPSGNNEPITETVKAMIVVRKS